ncbi:MAG: prephenate dehydratase [Candidatus Omnitrophota bacterium]
MNLNDLRKKIDGLDSQIIELLNKRARLSIDISKIKLSSGKNSYSPDREKEVLKKVARVNKGPLKQTAVEAIYREIMSGSLALAKRPIKVAYLGPEATFTQLAALKRFGSQVEYIDCASIKEEFNEVEKGQADYAVVPIENTTEGVINYTLDMLIDSDLRICSEITLPISHNLLAKSSRDKIQKIYSKREVFPQCRNWLIKHFPCVELIEVSSTSQAAKLAAKIKNSACIASSLAGKLYNLETVAANIEDSTFNITRFLVIGKCDARPTGNDKTSILFSVKDRVGALHDMLVPFKKYKINLTKIESRPSKRKAWEYYFFIDLIGHRDDVKVRSALGELEKKCNFLKILGSFPYAEK